MEPEEEEEEGRFDKEWNELRRSLTGVGERN
jgi:hypothetical protein